MFSNTRFRELFWIDCTSFVRFFGDVGEFFLRLFFFFLNKQMKVNHEISLGFFYKLLIFLGKLNPKNFAHLFDFPIFRSIFRFSLEKPYLKLCGDNKSTYTKAGVTQYSYSCIDIPNSQPHNYETLFVYRFMITDIRFSCLVSGCVLGFVW